MSTVAFPDIEEVAVGWLGAILDGHDLSQPVATKVPSPRPERFVRVQRTGGPQQTVVTDGAQVTIEVWDKHAPDAASTARIVRAELASAKNVTTPSGDLVYRVEEFSGPSLLPDVSQQPRYSWTVRVHVRGVPL